MDRLVYFESTEYVYEAICREKQLKKWNRWWKIELIEEENPCWKDLAEDWDFGETPGVNPRVTKGE